MRSFLKKRTIPFLLIACMVSLLVILGALPTGQQKSGSGTSNTNVTLEIMTKSSPMDGMEQIRIPQGNFLMGSTVEDIDRVMEYCSNCKREWLADETPQHTVYLDSYWIDKTEVTNGMFAKFVKETGYQTDAEWIGKGIVFNLLGREWRLVKGANWMHPRGPTDSIEDKSNHPVLQMTYKDAETYCKWAGRRLPTEAEWEKAARGTDGRVFPWGNQFPAGNLLNFADRNAYEAESDLSEDDGYSFTSPVGSFPDGASVYGVLDMAGNAAERVADWYGASYYANSPEKNPQGPSSGEYIIIRGGSWSRMTRYLRTTSRYRYLKENRSAGIGFRCAETISPEDAYTSKIPALTLSETSMSDYEITEFDKIHSPVGSGDNEFRIFGNVTLLPVDPSVSPQLSALQGRWEGFGLEPPVKNDWKYVLLIREIQSSGGTALLWAGTNLQYPTWVKEIRFRVVPDDQPSIEWQYSENNKWFVFTFTFNPEQKALVGWQKELFSPKKGPVELQKNNAFTVFKDYPRYLTEKGITAESYKDDILTQYYGKGYLVYEPEGYKDDPLKNWPLIIFFHGSGDRGDNIYLLAKASPFMMIREKGPLPFIIVAPLLARSENYFSFPDNYLRSVLDEIESKYRVDKDRIYITGLSIGGETAYRFALLEPDRFAAIAPLSAFITGSPSFDTIKDLPVLAIHGDKDPVIGLAVGQKPVDLLKKAGGNVTFKVLKNHDHDTWTDTYLDPGFYEWFLQHKKK